MRFPRGRCEEIEKCAGQGSDVVARKSTESDHVHGVVGVGIVDVEEKGGQGVVKEGGSVCCLFSSVMCGMIDSHEPNGLFTETIVMRTALGPHSSALPN